MGVYQVHVEFLPTELKCLNCNLKCFLIKQTLK